MRPGHLERQPLTVARDVRGARPEVARAIGGGEDDGDRALHRDVAVVETERIRDHPRAEIVLARERHLVEVRVRVHVRVPALRHRERRHLLPALAVPLQPARVGHGHALPRTAESVRSGELRRALGVACRAGSGRCPSGCASRARPPRILHTPASSALTACWTAPPMFTVSTWTCQARFGSFSIAIMQLTDTMVTPSITACPVAGSSG